jgi:hypothetical protein
LCALLPFLPGNYDSLAEPLSGMCRVFGIVGIKEYLYEPSGDTYTVIFEQIALNFGTREFVISNPRGTRTGNTSGSINRLLLV